MKHPIAWQQQRVNLSEIFRSLQGEGSRTGRPSVFVRLSGCNLRCTWRNPDGSESRCDTPYTSFEPERRMRTLVAVWQEVESLLQPGDDLVITGGEPLLWTESVAALVDQVPSHHVTIETNGTQTMDLASPSVLYSVSPKLANSQSGADLDAVARNINAVREAAVQIKFVVSLPEDLDDIAQFLERIKRPAQVYFMPQGATVQAIEERAAWVAEAALRMNVNYSDRLHVRLWSGRRGV